ncbi:hypothetical protein BDF19DRAFT_432202 [Syncephalis fuscata]|nr:hypothetical protein BDF19DRAFT_432202 [Syncephalis fuscata]
MPKEKSAAKTSAAAAGKKRKITPYNKFMKDQLAKYKAQHAGVKHVDAFKHVASMWKTSPDNPKNAKSSGKAEA